MATREGSDLENSEHKKQGHSQALKSDTRQAASSIGGPSLIDGPATDSLLSNSSPCHRRLAHLDATRIACVLCVAIEHGDSTFGAWNVIFTQGWVLQLLFIVAGTTFALSRQSLGFYLARLVLYFCIGVSMNLLAWVVTGKDWKHNIFNVVFQFWFVYGLMMYCVLLYPLKPFLLRTQAESIRRWGSDDPDLLIEPAGDPAFDTSDPSAQATGLERGKEERHTFIGLWVCAIVVPLVVLSVMHVLEQVLQVTCAPGLWSILQRSSPLLGDGVSYWGLVRDGDVGLEQAKALIHSLCYYLQCSLCSVCMLLALPRAHNRTSLVGWVIFINMYANRMLFFRFKYERPFHGFDLFLLAFVCSHLGLRYRVQVGTMLVRYWLVVLIVCGLVWVPGTFRRMDENPPEHLLTRCRVNFLEGLFVLLWLTAGERIFDALMFSNDKLGFLNTWALVVFLVHKAIHIVFPWPVNWTLLLVLVPVCWACSQRKEFCWAWSHRAERSK